MDGDGSDYEVNEGPDGSSFSDKVVGGFRDISPRTAPDELKSAEEGSVGQQVGSDSNDVVEKEKRPEELHKGGMGEKEDAGNKKDVAGAGSAVKTAVTGAGAAVGAAKAGGILARVGKFGPMLIIMIIIFAIAIGGIVATSLMIGTIKENLIKALGYEDTVAILEKVAEYEVRGILAEGEMPDGLAADFLAQGIEVGQVTLAGDFVRTNKYLAELDGVEVAANGEYYGGSKGELAVRFKDEIIKADDFVVAVESSPELYAAYSEGLDMAARYYYSDEVDEVYNDMGIDRNAFRSWEPTGDAKKDQEEFDKILAEMLDVDSDTNTSGKYTYWEEIFNDKGEHIGWHAKPVQWCYPSVDINSGDGTESCSGAEGWTEGVVTGTRKNNDNGTTAEQNAAQLLNTTIAAKEPEMAARAFMGMIEPIEQAQVGDNGPVNELMNTLTESTTITYRDVNTGEVRVDDRSILETTNFVAAVTDGTYSREEANNFSLDRSLKAAEGIDGNYVSNDAIEDSVVSVGNNDDSGSGMVMRNKEMGDNDGPDGRLGDAMKDGADMTLVQESSDTYSSALGANRVINGGAYISEKMNQQVLGALASDYEAVTEYQEEVDEVLSRKVEADRATKSPFDVSSPNTFMGSLVRTLATTLIKSYSSKDKVPLGASFGMVSGLFDASVSGLTNVVLADGSENRYSTLVGDCHTPDAAGAVGDLYCNQHNTLVLDYIEYTDKDWQNKLTSKNLDSKDGSIVLASEDTELGEGGDLAKFILLGADRAVRVGSKSAETCKRYKEIKESEETWWEKLASMLKEVFGRVVGAGQLENECTGVEVGVATGVEYTLSSKNENVEQAKLYSAYMLHDRVKSLLTEEESAVTAFRKEYYEAHPLDNSYEGRLARISGLSVDEVKIALGYQEFLTRIAQYNPQERYNFVAIMELPKDALQFSKDTNTAIGIYGLWSRRFEHADTRSRVYLV